ncbi:MAG: glycosyltransferase family 87 protein [Candidatus Glassbacteria bacterium]
MPPAGSSLDSRNSLLIRVVLAGALIRLAIMPFTLHFDLLVIGHVADLFSRYGRTAFDPEVMAFYFPPVVYLLLWPFMKLGGLFSADLSSWLESAKPFIYSARPFENWIYFLLDGPASNHLYRNLFLLKTGLLAADLTVLFLLMRLVESRQDKLTAAILWAVNPAVLHSVFAHGAIDIFVALWLTAALAAAVARRPGAALVLLVLGAFTKLFPLLIIPPLVLAARRDLAGRLKLAVLAGVLTLLAAAAFYGLLGIDPMAIAIGPGEMMVDPGLAVKNLIRKTGLILTYSAYLVYLYRRSRPEETDLDSYLAAFLVPGLIVFAFNPVGFRYWVWISPLVIIWLVRHPRFWPVAALNLTTLFVLRVLPQQSLQAGLFKPLHPAFFSSIPAYTMLTEPVVSQFVLLRTFNLLFMASSLLFALLVWFRNAGSVQAFWKRWSGTGGAVVYGLLAVLILLPLAGVIKDRDRTNPASSRRAELQFIGGYQSEPDSVVRLGDCGGSLDQELNLDFTSFTAVSIWLELEGVPVDRDSVVVRVSWPAEPGSGEIIAALPLHGLQPGPQRFEFGNTVRVEGRQPRLSVEQRTSGEVEVEVGLVSNERLAEDIKKTWFGPWKVPGRGPDGRIRLTEPGVPVPDFRRASSRLEQGWQLDLGFYTEVPRSLAAAAPGIRLRLGRDLPLAGALAAVSALLLVGILSPRLGRKTG